MNLNLHMMYGHNELVYICSFIKGSYDRNEPKLIFFVVKMFLLHAHHAICEYTQMEWCFNHIALQFSTCK